MLNKYRIGIIIFAVANTVFVAALLFWLVPIAQNLRYLNSGIARQQNRYTIHMRHYMGYGDNAQEFADLSAQRRLVNSYEVAEIISDIVQIAEDHELRIMQLTVGEPVTTGAYGLDTITITYVAMENVGNEINLKKFLQEITAMHITVYRAEIEWYQQSMARISIEMRIFSS